MKRDRYEALPLQRRDYFLAVSSGILLALSFPLPGASLLAWIAFVPLFLAIGRRSARSCLKLGFCAGMVANGGILYWLNIAMVTYGKLHWSVSLSLYLILTAYLSLFPAIVFWLVRRGMSAGISPLFSFPVFWVGFEYVRAHLMTGFPWASLGYSQYRMIHLIQVGDISGVYGISFLVAMGNIVAYRIIAYLTNRTRFPFPTAGAAAFAALLALTLGYGTYRLHEPESGTQLNVALIQGNISQDVKWDPAFQESTVATYERLSRKAALQGIDLMVWPESAAPFFFQGEPAYAARIMNLAAELKSGIVFGSPAFERVGNDARYFNSAFLVGPSGQVLGRSDKIHLVPFGEYVPMAKLFPFVQKMVAGIGDFSPGAKATPLETAKGPIGVLVCFEGIFPEIARAYVKAGSRLLVNISNDAWYKRSTAPYQHLSMTVFRAIENRVPLVRATNTGITAIIDRKGRIQDTTRLFEETIMTGEVKLGAGKSVYTGIGDLFAQSCLVVSVILCTLALARKPEGR